MKLPNVQSAKPAVEAPPMAVGAFPEMQSTKTISRDVTAHFWHTPWLSTAELGPRSFRMQR